MNFLNSIPALFLCKPWTITGVFVGIIVVLGFAICLRRCRRQKKVEERAASMQAASSIATVFLALVVLFLTCVQADDARRKAAAERTANWYRLYASCSSIIMNLNPGGGTPAFKALPVEAKVARFSEVQNLLFGQVNNPVLTENKECLEQWQGMFAVVTADAYEYRNGQTDAADGRIEGIMKKWEFVWTSLIQDFIPGNKATNPSS